MRVPVILWVTRGTSWLQNQENEAGGVGVGGDKTSRRSMRGPRGCEGERSPGTQVTVPIMTRCEQRHASGYFLVTCTYKA